MTDFRRFGTAVNADLYLEDNSLLGLAKEFKIPPGLEWKTVEIETLGQIAVYKAPSRVLEAMEGSIKLQAAEPDLLADFYNPTITHKLQMHQQVDINGPDGVDLEKSFTLITLASVRFFKTEFGGASLGGEAEEIDLEFPARV